VLVDKLGYYRGTYTCAVCVRVRRTHLRSLHGQGPIWRFTKRSGVCCWLWYKKLDTAMDHGSRTKCAIRGSFPPHLAAVSGHAKSGLDEKSITGRGSDRMGRKSPRLSTCASDMHCIWNSPSGRPRLLLLVWAFAQ
jgi:hypothetical protein